MTTNIVLTKTGTRVLTTVVATTTNLLTPLHPPKSWAPIQPITYEVTTLTDTRITIMQDNKPIQYLIKGYTAYPITDLADTSKSPLGSNQAKVYVTKFQNATNYLVLLPDNKGIDLIYLDGSGNVLNWLNGVILTIQN